MATPDQTLNVTYQHTSFQRGALSPKLLSRTDTQVYAGGAEVVDDFQLMMQGGVTRRPGTVAELEVTSIMTGAGATKGRLERFKDSTGASFLMLFVAGELRIWPVDGDGLLGTMVTFTGQPWTDGEVKELGVLQSGDTMIVLHKTFKPRVVRWDGSNFDISLFAFDRFNSGWPIRQPYYKFAGPDDKMSVSGNTGSITVTLSGPTSAGYFTADHVGSIVRYLDREIEITAVASGTSATGTVRERLPDGMELSVNGTYGFKEGDIIVGQNSKAVGYVAAVPSISRLDVMMIGSSRGFENEKVISNDGAETTVTGTTIVGPFSVALWDDQVFSDRWGYPSTAAFHDQRLWLSGHKTLTTHVWASRLGEFFNFGMPLFNTQQVDDVADDDAIAVQLDSDQISQIRYVVSNRHLIILADAGEFYMPQLESRAITPLSVSIRLQTPYGCSTVRPIVFDGAVLFADRNSTAIREFLYTDTESAYVADSLTLQAEHLLKTVVDMDASYAGLETEEQYAYVAMADGTLAQFLSLRKESIAGWVRWTFDGVVEAVRVLDTRLYALIKRTIDGTDRWFIERFTNDLYLDYARPLSGYTATQNGNDVDLTGLTHYAGKKIMLVDGLSVWAGSDETGYLVDASGAVTIPNTTTAAIAGADVGLPVVPRIKTLPLALDVGTGPTQGVKMRVNQAMMWILDSVTFSVQGRRITARRVADPVEAAPQARSGFYRVYLLGWDDFGQVEVLAPLPLPLSILGMTLEVTL